MKISNLYRSIQSVPIVFGSGINALGLVRSFGLDDKYVVIYAYRKDIACCSKYAVWKQCPNPLDKDSFITFLESEGQKFHFKPFILVTNDEWLIPISKNEQRLSKYYIFSMSSWNVIENCTIKKNLYHILEGKNITLPWYIVCSSIDELLIRKLEIQYPVIIKPSVTIDFDKLLPSIGRNCEIHSVKDLEQYAQVLYSAGISGVDFIVQELIPGGAENLYTITTLSDKNGDIIAYSTGHKIRQFPPNAGTIVSGEVIYVEKLYDEVVQIIRELKFFGIANTEFKYDSRDQRYKLIEINPRPGKWNSSVLATGINLPQLAYNLFVLHEKPSVIPICNKCNIIWADFFTDAYYALFGFGRKGYKIYAMSLKEYMNSIKGKKYEAVFKWNDLKPFIRMLYNHLRRL